MLVCSVCKGEKVVRTPVSNYTKVDICPKCNGTGRLMSDNDWRKNSSKRLIKG